MSDDVMTKPTMSARLKAFLDDKPTPKLVKKRPNGTNFPTGAMTRSDAARYLGIERRTLLRLQQREVIKPFRTAGEDAPYFTREQLDTFRETWEPYKRLWSKK